MQKLKILHLITNFDVGGAQKLLLDLVRNCNRNRFEISIISLYDRKENSFANEFEKANCNIIYLNKSLGFDLDIILKLLRKIKEIKPDIIHTHLAGLKYATIPLLFCKVKIKINTEHTVIKENYSNIETGIKKFAYKILKFVPVGISNSVTESIVNIYKINNVKTIYNGIDLTSYSYNVERELKPRDIKLITVASLLPDKNHEFLIEAVNVLRNRNTNFKLILVGAGDLRKDIEKKVKQYSLEECVTFLGLRKDINKLLTGSDIFLMPSKHEGFGLVLVEAMAAGLPIVATNVGGIPEIIINNENGFLVPHDQPELFANAIEALIKDKKKYKEVSKNNLVSSRKFDIVKTNLEYENIYCKVT